MKYLIILVDGMADYPIQELGGRTPLEAADIPAIDALAQGAEMGMVRTVPDGMAPGSDTANLSVMGYEPEIYHTGRSPLEAASMGVELEESDVTFRCNLVTLKGHGELEEKTMLDHSAGEISSEEARILINAVGQELGNGELHFYPGVSYRHLLVWNRGPFDFDLTPPHDILGQAVAAYLPKGPYGPFFLDLTRRARAILESHPVNQKRKVRGLNPANSIWIWGEGKKPKLSPFREKYGPTGAVISAVDLIYGIGILAGLRPVHVEGATGNIHTNFTGKAEAAIEVLSGKEDFLYLHLEAPDECSHQGDLKCKIRSIELIDRKVVAPIVAALENQAEPYRIMILPDHPTPLSLRTHVAEPVPYLLYDSTLSRNKESDKRFTEAWGNRSGIFQESGPLLMKRFISG
jgi:2,3-bisphosphoglycerate-independent phosphoglycerate mutase